ncbi:protein TonB [Ulvibacter sp. MAR_2010_11]|uniref:energy transducer TonB n=1 Tax=Ulvibacter sp. MAR_2010_11 TaxID=1250229 RepID=UPI000C2B691A|nr:energy transducer TonB [Ulvibacter sp. MAR_2010_11]PKA83260.1 protein TonB [Ulvibacter sp. MAR_2010_11]
MKPSVNIFKSNQPKLLSKREDKKSINITWNSRLFFQLGLIVSLLTVFFVMESTFGLTADSYAVKKRITIDEPNTIHTIVIMDETPKSKVLREKQIPKTPKVKQRAITNVIPMVDTPDNDTQETPVAPNDNPPVNTNPNTLSTTTTLPDDNKPRSLLGVEFVPVFPGCEKLATNKERIECMSSKISSFIGNRFNTDKFSDNASGKPQRIDVQFKIDSHGNVTDVRARARDNSLAEEAKRVVDRLPQMQPGKQGGRNVDVMYSIPITVIIN